MLSLAKPDMSACGRLEQNPSPENTPFLESLSSWNPIINDSIPWTRSPFKKNESWKARSTYSSNSDGGATCVMNSESLQLCTEGLGFESLDGVEDMKSEASCSRPTSTPTSTSVSGQARTPKQYKRCIRSFPPPISSLGRAGCFKSYRQDGRFLLQEVRIPTQQRCFHACREDGRLRLSFVQSNDDDDDVEEENNEVLEDD